MHDAQSVPAATDVERWFSPAGLAAHEDVPRKLVYAAISDEADPLPHARPGGKAASRILIKLADWRAWLERRKMTTPRSPARAPKKVQP